MPKDPFIREKFTKLRQAARNENLVQTDPNVAAAVTQFPPQKQQNGGGTVLSVKGQQPVFIPPSFNPIDLIPPKSPP